MSPTIRFDDGTAYEESMGRWSEIAGAEFLAWLAPPVSASWLDIGCGTGVFSRMIAKSCAPAAVTAIDPSEGQLAYARQAQTGIHYQQADAQALPFPAASFDQAVMALVIFFLPDPAKGVAEMARILRPGGTASAYAWDSLGGGTPTVPIQRVLEAHGHQPPSPPSPAASSLAQLRALWSAAGFTGIETRTIEIGMHFENFDAYWAMMRRMSRVSPLLDRLGDTEIEAIRADLRQRVAPGPDGPFTAPAHANAVRGHLPPPA